MNDKENQKMSIEIVKSKSLYENIMNIPFKKQKTYPRYETSQQCQRALQPLWLKKENDSIKKTTKKITQIEVDDVQTPEQKSFQPTPENLNYAQHYLNQILIDENQFSPQNFLKHHFIQKEVRAKMIDWLIEIIISYGFKSQTHCRAVNILDRYLQKSNRQFSNNNIHLLGVCCLFIASKYEEVYPLRMESVYDKIGHKKLSREAIKQTEMEILQELDFNITGPIVTDFVSTCLIIIKIKEQIDQSCLKSIDLVIYSLSKFVVCDYDTVSKFTQSYIAIGILYIVFKIIQQIQPEFDVPSQMKIIKKLLNIYQEDKIIKISEQILNLAKNYRVLHPTMINSNKIFDEMIQELNTFQTE